MLKPPKATLLAVGLLGLFILFVFIAVSGGDRPSQQQDSATVEVTQAFDIPSLIGKDIDQIKDTLGAPQSDTEPTEAQLQAGVDSWDKSWEKYGITLLVTYDPSTRNVTDFFISIPTPSGATKDKSALLKAGSIEEGNPKYAVKFVQARKGPAGSYTGMIVTPR